MTVHATEAEALAGLYQARSTGVSMRKFAASNGLGSGSMVWQYLHAKRGLSLLAAMRFARGLQIELKDFSPRLAAEWDALSDRTATRMSAESGRTEEADEYRNVRCVQLILRKGTGEFETRPLLPRTSTIAFRKDWLTRNGYRHDKLLAIESNDEAMEKTIYKGDLVVMNTADQVLVEGEAFSINVEGRLRIRRMILEGGSWWMIGDHEDLQRHPRRRFSEKQCFTLGRIVHRQSERI